MQHVANRRKIAVQNVSDWCAAFDVIRAAVQRGQGKNFKLRPLVKYRQLGEELFFRYLAVRELLLAVTTRCLDEWGWQLNTDYRSMRCIPGGGYWRSFLLSEFHREAPDETKPPPLRAMLLRTDHESDRLQEVGGQSL